MEILDKVKINLGITGTYQDEIIQGYIDEVKLFLIDGGISLNIVNSNNVIGLITRGVADLWNYGSGGTELSPYFLKRASQLKSLTRKQLMEENLLGDDEEEVGEDDDE